MRIITEELMMKRYVSVLLIFITICAVLAVSACAKPPTAEMENAAAAVARAENEPNVLVYAENMLRQAQDRLVRMNEAANSKQYDEARRFAQEAVSLAERAINEARSAETSARAAEAAAAASDEKARTDVSNLINSVKASITEAEQALQNAQKVENIRLDINAITYEIDTAKKHIQDAETFLAGKQYDEAEDAAAAARSSVSSAMTWIADAARESSKKK